MTGPRTREVVLSRRKFVIGSSVLGTAGLGIGLIVPATAETTGDSSTNNGTINTHQGSEVTAWIVITPDNHITIRIARSEMGQGTLTGLAQLVAEELACDWDSIRWEFPTPGQSLSRGRPWGSFSTGGSRGIRNSQQYVREGGALARQLLLTAAAQRWQVSVDECHAENSIITHQPSGETIQFGDVALLASTLPIPTAVTLKNPDDWQVIGRPVKRLDTREKVTGTLRYAADIKLPGMLQATISACPVHGGKRGKVDSRKAVTMPGVKKVVMVGDDAVAVVADYWWQAKQALDSVSIEWLTGASGQVDSASIHTVLKDGLTASDTFIGHNKGNAQSTLNQADNLVTADYSYPFQNHAPMEPMNATVLWTPSSCEAWVPTQNGEAALEVLADAAGLFREQCEVHKTILGGGFGRRSNHDYLVQATDIARQFPGIPIKLMWSREEDQRRGVYHPITHCRMTATLHEDGEKQGLPKALHVRISGQSILAALRAPLGEETIDKAVFQSLDEEGDHAFVYDIEHVLADHAMRNTHLRPWFWRGVNINQNVFYIESFIDELAFEVGSDPLDYRRRLLADNPKALAVLNEAAERAHWGRKRPESTGLGLAVCKAFGSYVAACAEVSVSEGNLRMHNIWAATDPGVAVNPQQIEAQVAGSFVYGLSAALYSELTVKDGRVEQENFDTYPSMKLAAMPHVETTVMPSGGFWGGVGEPTIAVGAPAVINGVYAATGVRIRHLPVKNQALG